MVNATDVINVLWFVSIALSIYTARLVCKDPSFDRLNIPYLASLRSYAGCPALATVTRPVSTAKENVVPFTPDPTAPRWAKIVAELDRTREFPASATGAAAADVVRQIAAKRVPQLLTKAPLKTFKDFDASLINQDIEFWNVVHHIKRRADGKGMFARENYNPADVILKAAVDEAPSSSTSRYFTEKSQDLRAMLTDMYTTGAPGISEFVSHDLHTMLDHGVPVKAFELSPFEEGTDTSKQNKEEARSVVLSTIEPPGVQWAPLFSPSHMIQLQIFGTRKLLLFPPERWFDLQIYPLGSPRRGQSTLDFMGDHLPRNYTVAAMQTELRAGEMLYIPPFWTVRTAVPEVAQEELVPSTFSISSQVVSVSSEENVHAAVEKMAQPEEILKIVAAMASDGDEMKDAEERKRAATAWLVKELYDLSGMKATESIERLLKRMTAQAELQNDFLKGHSLRCIKPVKRKLLEQKAQSVMKNLASAVTQSKSLLVASYKNLDERYGLILNRITAVWRIVIEALVEKIILLVGQKEYVELTACIADDLLQG